MFTCTKLSRRNGRCELGYVLGLLVHDKVVIEFGRNVSSRYKDSNRPRAQLVISTGAQKVCLLKRMYRLYLTVC